MLQILVVTERRDFLQKLDEFDRKVSGQGSFDIVGVGALG